MSARTPRGFTLIEVMICIAILAIVMGTGALVWNRSLSWFNREHDYSLALQLAGRAVDDLRRQPYDTLPPFVVPRPALAAWKEPAGPLVVAGTRTARDVTTSKGAASIVSYQFEVPVRGGEAARVPTSAPYVVHLQNEPVREVLDVIRLDTPKPTRVRPEKSVPSVEFDAAQAGAVVRVDYLGRVRILASGAFVDADLRATSAVGSAKLIRLQVRYGKEHQGCLDLTMVKMP